MNEHKPDNIADIRARSEMRASEWESMGHVCAHYRADIATLLSHIDAQDRAIAAHKRDEEQRAETEAAAYENGRKAALDQLRAVLTPDVLDEMQIMTRKIWPTEPACTFKVGRLYEIEELLHD